MAGRPGPKFGAAPRRAPASEPRSVPDRSGRRFPARCPLSCPRHAGSLAVSRLSGWTAPRGLPVAALPTRRPPPAPPMRRTAPPCRPASGFRRGGALQTPLWAGQDRPHAAQASSSPISTSRRHAWSTTAASVAAVGRGAQPGQRGAAGAGQARAPARPEAARRRARCLPAAAPGSPPARRTEEGVPASDNAYEQGRKPPRDALEKLSTKIGARLQRRDHLASDVRQAREIESGNLRLILEHQHGLEPEAVPVEV